MAFKDADRFGYELSLPFRGNTYRVESPDYKTGMKVTENAALAGYISQLVEAGEEVPEETMKKLVLDDDEEQDYYKKLLGGSLEKMIEDQCPLEYVKLAAATVTVWVLTDKEKAEEYYNSGGRPNRRRPTDRKKSSRRTSTKATPQG